MSKPDIKRPGRKGTGGKPKRERGHHGVLIGEDDMIDEYTESTWHSPQQTASKPVPINNKTRAFDFPSKAMGNGNPYFAKSAKQMSESVPIKPDLSTRQKSQEMIYNQLNGTSPISPSNKKQYNVHKGYHNKPLPENNKREKHRNDENGTRVSLESPKNLIIKINHINKSDKKNESKNGKKSKSKKKGKTANVVFDIGQQQILGDILIHLSSWNQLIAKHNNNHIEHNNNNNANIPNNGWKTVYCVIDQQKIQFWDIPQTQSNDTNYRHHHHHHHDEEKHKNEANITIYLSEILTLHKSIRSIDNEKYIIELNICDLKCLLSFSNIEQREYWHSLLSDYHLNYFIWRSTPLDDKKRTSQNVINGVHKLLKSQKQSTLNKEIDLEKDTLNIYYIEEILQKISSLNITKIIDIVPLECKFMSGRLIRVIMSIKYFFMSVLKSLSGADIPLPSRDILMEYLDEIENLEWNHMTKEILDYYIDQCYRILFNLSFAFTSNARDEIMKLNEYIDFKKLNKSSIPNTKRQRSGYGGGGGVDGNVNIEYELDQKKIAEMKFEYESLQRSWKMHRDRLQEYVMAYRDAVAKLKHSYHQRDKLSQKVELLQREKKKLNESIQLQSKNHDSMMQQAQKLAQKFSTVSQQMNTYYDNSYQIEEDTNHNIYNQPQQHQQQHPQKQKQHEYYPSEQQSQSDDIKQSEKSRKIENGKHLQASSNDTNQSEPFSDSGVAQMRQLSQEMTNLFNMDPQPHSGGYDQSNPQNANNKYTWI